MIFWYACSSTTFFFFFENSSRRDNFKDYQISVNVFLQEIDEFKWLNFNDYQINCDAFECLKLLHVSIFIWERKMS